MDLSTILVVEYDPAIRQLIGELVWEAGYIPWLWSAECEAFALIQAQQPDLVIVDLWLQQRGDGLALAKRLWDDPQTRHIPILVCTTDTWMLDECADLLHMMGCSTLTKPFMADDLLAQITARLDGQADMITLQTARHAVTTKTTTALAAVEAGA